MFCLSRQERNVLLAIAVTIALGACARFFIRTPQIAPAAEAPRTIKIININQAAQQDIEAVPGIGPVLAGRIVDYRKQNGSFLNLDDLKKVKGLGGKKAESIKNYLSF